MTIHTTLNDLQHSVYTHVMIQGGPNPQLCVFLTKLLDFMDDLYAANQSSTDMDARIASVEAEVKALAFNIIESLAIWLATSVDDPKFSDHLQHQGRQLLILVAEARKLPDKLIAKDVVLRAIASMIRSLKVDNPKLAYPDIKDVRNNVL